MAKKKDAAKKAQPTARDVAAFMFQHLTKNGRILYQRSIASDIEKEYGLDFVYTNKKGHRAIAPNVLFEFRKLTEAKFVWSRRQLCWRLRRDCDGPTSRRGK